MVYLLLLAVLLAFVAGYFIKMYRIDPADVIRKIHLENKKREHKVKTGPFYENLISEEDFQDIVRASVKTRRILRKRVTEICSSGLVVYGSVLSRSESSEWGFEVDFNDDGHLTGKYKITSEAEGSSVPVWVAIEIHCSIEELYNERLRSGREKGKNDLGYDWFCDYCNDHMNDQPGFSIERGTWVCERCGFINDVTIRNVNRYVHVVLAKRSGEDHYDYYAFSVLQYPSRRSAMNNFKRERTEDGVKIYAINGERYTKIVYGGIHKDSNQ